MNTCIIISILLGVGIVVLSIVALKAIVVYNDHQKRLEELSRYNINVNAVIDETIPNILESFVQSEFNTYQAKYLVIDAGEDGYITDEQQKHIIDDMVQICSDRLSPAMVDKLSLFWNHRAIASIIADQIYLTVVAFVSQRNATQYVNV